MSPAGYCGVSLTRHAVCEMYSLYIITDRVERPRLNFENISCKCAAAPLTRNVIYKTPYHQICITSNKSYAIKRNISIEIYYHCDMHLHSNVDTAPDKISGSLTDRVCRK